MNHGMERRCGATVPDALRGNLAAGTCTLVVNIDGWHVGQHKAHYSAYPVGKVTFRWRTGWRKVSQPPVVQLPKTSFAEAMLNSRLAQR